MKARTGSRRYLPQKLRKVPKTETAMNAGQARLEHKVKIFVLDFVGRGQCAVEVAVGNCMAGGGGGLFLGFPSLRGGCWVLVLSLTRMRWMTGRS